MEGYILAPEWKPELQGSCTIASHNRLMNRSVQNSSKLQHTATTLEAVWLFKGLTARTLYRPFSVKGLTPHFYYALFDMLPK